MKYTVEIPVRTIMKVEVEAESCYKAAYKATCGININYWDIEDEINYYDTIDDLANTDNVIAYGEGSHTFERYTVEEAVMYNDNI